MQLRISIISFLLVSGLWIQCTSVKFSNAVKGEQRKMAVVADVNNDILATAKLENQAAGRGAEDILGKGVSLAVSGIKSLINADKKKYAVEYEGVLNELYFYNNISTQEEGVLDPTGIQFKGFDFDRMVKADGKRIRNDTALHVRFEIDQDDPYEIVNNSIFRLKLKQMKLNYAKAKVPSQKWYVPWTWFSKNVETINLDFDIVIKATWFSKEGTFYENVPLGKFNFTVRNLPLDPVKQKAFLASDQGPLGKRCSGYSMLVPRSFSSFVSITRGNKPTYEHAYGKGIYRIDMKVKESSKQSFVLKSFYENSDAIIDSGSKMIK